MQQTLNAEKPPIELRGDGAQKLNVKSVPNTSIQNTPTLNIEWVSQDNLRPPANPESQQKSEGPKIVDSNAQ